MMTAAFMLSCLMPAHDVAPNVRLVYHGTLTADSGGDETAKKFQFEVVLRRDGDATVWDWIVEEQGHGRWDWPHRFGRAVVRGEGTGDDLPSLYYDRGDVAHVVAVPLPRWSGSDNLSTGMTWDDEGTTYRVGSRTTRGAHPVWKVAVEGPRGKRATLRVDPERRLIVSAEHRVFVGRGEQHTLTLDLESIAQLSEDAAIERSTAFDAMLSVRRRAGFKRGALPAVWSAEQLAAIAAGLEAADDLPDAGVARLHAAATANHRQHAQRLGVLKSQKNRMVGKTIRPFQLNQTTGDSYSSTQLAGQVTVLHFWEYRDSPLQEPYGQVGFLDYLYRQRAKDGVVVLGIAVAPRDADPTITRPVAAAARRLAAFMNLDYPVLVDDGTLLKQFGDPRSAGAALPMVIVVDSKGEITHYHVGLYPVEQNQGLRELNSEISRALEKRE